MQREQELNVLNARLAQLNQELSVLSQTDALTGLANRRAFDQRLAEEVSRAARHAVPVALLVVDIDHFKAYNDHYGHPAGDACLRQVAAVLRECAGRPIDLVARLGGEEFAVLLPHQGSADAMQVAERCLRAVEAAAIAHAGSPVAPHVTLSVGVAQSTKSAQTPLRCSPQPTPRCTVRSGRVGVGSRWLRPSDTLDGLLRDGWTIGPRRSLTSSRRRRTTRARPPSAAARRSRCSRPTNRAGSGRGADRDARTRRACRAGSSDRGPA